MATGLSGVVCACYGLVQKNEMEDLQKGERYHCILSNYKTACIMGWLTNYRYTNMDFIVFYSLIDSKNKLLVFSYDIACQWSQKLSQPQSQLLNSMWLSDKQLHFLRFAIPKFHILAHGLDCQSTFSFNYQPHMACTDSEDLEHWWAHINPASMSTKEMGLGTWIDMLDDHASAWNW